eukprot:4227185-Pyramimonas_sp.AAC.1
MGVPKRVRRRHSDLATGAFGRASHEAAKRVMVDPKWARCRHEGPATGAHDGATKRLKHLPNLL